MNNKRKEARKKLKDIPKITTFNELLEQSTLTDDEKDIVRKHYLHKMPLEVIADFKGYSISNMRVMHRKILDKLAKII